MDRHPVISVQQRTPDNDFCHFSISNVRFAFWAFFENRKNSVSHRVKMMTRWPSDPVPCLVSVHRCTDTSMTVSASWAELLPTRHDSQSVLQWRWCRAVSRPYQLIETVNLGSLLTRHSCSYSPLLSGLVCLAVWLGRRSHVQHLDLAQANR